MKPLLFIRTYLKWALIVIAMLLVGWIAHWFVTENPLEYTLQDVREFSKQLFLYSFTAAVAILGYWWNQREQNKRHDDQLYEARWNKTLDQQLEALREQSKMRIKFKKTFRDIPLENTYLYVQRMLDELEEQTDHAMFYLNNDDYYIVDILIEMTSTIMCLNERLPQYLPIPDSEQGNIELNTAVVLMLHSYSVRLSNQSCLLDWEIGRLINGKMIERYDLNYGDEGQFGGHCSVEEYDKYRAEEYAKTRADLNLPPQDSNTFV
ncbi:hypothetical protein [Vibrio parahaemolyticus]|uniref:hypothetical protein n=1 Tax=Vibrio parahaemolyticus TaxID=670 RepID=UPI001112D4FE|nr:hypothetical protein [Vibrio parahaemolyticus]EJE8518661.1 hypothetical protein [Vibrio parahaemolyticus]HCH5747668.1 hypothetical protein [Vibrio parahaemolyticus]